MDIAFATGNAGELEQARTLFQGWGIRVLSPLEAGIEGTVIKNGATLEINAMKEAWHAYLQNPTLWAVGEDTGLFIHALADEPGVHTARWAGEHAATEEITRHCLERMCGLIDRTATFKTVIDAISPDGRGVLFTGELEGYMLDYPRVPAKPGLPYSPLFVPQGHTVTLAEMTAEEENAISHRGQAFRKFLDFIEKSRS